MPAVISGKHKKTAVLLETGIGIVACNAPEEVAVGSEGQNRRRLPSDGQAGLLARTSLAGRHGVAPVQGRVRRRTDRRSHSQLSHNGTKKPINFAKLTIPHYTITILYYTILYYTITVLYYYCTITVLCYAILYYAIQNTTIYHYRKSFLFFVPFFE